MPRLIEGKWVATEKELLNFANKVRVAGGADILDALLPSTPAEATECLIARALNFKCTVATWMPIDERIDPYWSDGSSKWVMEPDRGSPDQSNELTRELAKKLKLRLVRNEDARSDKGYRYGLLLPKIIGNSASAFDAGYAFQEYDKTRKKKTTIAA